MTNLDYSQNTHHKVVNYFSEHLFENLTLTDVKRFLASEKINYEEFESVFLAKKLALISGENIFLNFEHRFIRTLKKARDLYLIETLPPSVRGEIVFVSHNMLTKMKDDISTILLIGSAARGKLGASSDLDFFVILNRALGRDLLGHNKKSRIELQFSTRIGFGRLFRDRDELALWALKYGLIIYDDDYVFDYYLPSELQVGEKTVIKKRRMIQRLIDDISDSPNATEKRIRHKLTRLIFQMARYILILNDELPLSRSELPDQLMEYAPELAKKISEFESKPVWDRDELLRCFYEFRSLYDRELMQS